MQTPDLKQLFQKFINNQCTDAEREEVLFYIRNAQIPPEFEALMQENLDQKLASGQRVSPEISERIRQRIQEKILPAGKTSLSGPKLLPRRWLAIAATVSLSLLASWVYFNFPGWGHSYQVYTTTYGETRSLQLPDGSQVVLNANSKLTLSSDWPTALIEEEAFVREVWLEGEGFFDVKKLSKPIGFVVHTDDLEVEVLGTRFNVNSREQITRVVLDEGKVKLSTQHQPELIMKPGELVELTKVKPQFQKKKVNPDTYLAWRHDELVFEATPLTEIIDMLKDNYGYEVIIHHEAVTEDMLFTGKAPADDTSLLLEMLSESFDLSILQDNKKIVFE